MEGLFMGLQLLIFIALSVYLLLIVMDMRGMLSPMARKVLDGIEVSDVDLRGAERRKYIEDAGYDYEEIKKEINDYYNISIKD